MTTRQKPPTDATPPPAPQAQPESTSQPTTPPAKGEPQPSPEEREKRLAEGEARLREEMQKAEAMQAALAEGMRKAKEANARLEELDKLIEEKSARLRARAAMPEEVAPEPQPLPDDSTIVINLRASEVAIDYAPMRRLTLRPGANTVKRAEWEASKRHPFVRVMLEAGQDPFGKDGLRDTGTAFSKDLASVTDALVLVGSLTDGGDIERVLHGESRAVVRKRAEEQLAKVREAIEKVRS